MISNLGREYAVTDKVLKKAELFAIQTIYKHDKSTSLNEARALNWKQMKNKTTIRLPPDQDSLTLHVRRANYQAYVWNSYAAPHGPQTPFGHGWNLENDTALPILAKTPAIAL